MSLYLVNTVLHGVAIFVLVKLYMQTREIAQNVKMIKDLDDKLTKMDRHYAGQITRIAQGISADIGKLRELDTLESKG